MLALGPTVPGLYSVVGVFSIELQCVPSFRTLADLGAIAPGSRRLVPTVGLGLVGPVLIAGCTITT
jgi:hypothetical protein